MPVKFQSLLGDKKTLHTTKVSENNFLVWEMTYLILSFVPRNGIWADFEKTLKNITSQRKAFCVRTWKFGREKKQIEAHCYTEVLDNINNGTFQISYKQK